MTVWQDDRWQDDQLTGWPDDQMTGWLDDRMTGWQDDRITRWPDDRKTGSFADDWPYGIFHFLLGFVTPWKTVGVLCILFTLFCWVVGSIICIYYYHKLWGILAAARPRHPDQLWNSSLTTLTQPFGTNIKCNSVYPPNTISYILPTTGKIHNDSFVSLIKLIFSSFAIIRCI